MRPHVALASAVAVLALAGSAGAQRNPFTGYFGDPNEFYTPPAFHGNPPYDGRFTFARIKYRGYAHMTDEGPGWSHDYPESDEHFMKLVRELTSVRPFVDRGPIHGGVIVALDDPLLFRYPVAYFSEPGGWFPNEKEVEGMRKYLLKGGFIIFDDFGDMRGMGNQTDWLNTTKQLRRVLPDAKFVKLDESHPIFHSFYDISFKILPLTYRGVPEYWGIFQDNDPKKRLLVILNRNNDIGEYWQWSDRGFAPVSESNEAYEIGINYIVYALTH